MDNDNLERRVAPVYHELIVSATNQYLNSEPVGLHPLERAAWRDAHVPVDTSQLTDQEFTEVILSANRQPLNPITVARNAPIGAGHVGAEDLTDIEISQALRDEYLRLEKLYIDHGINPEPLRIAWNLIHLTESYIAGYSRQIDRINQKLLSYSPVEGRPYNGLERWNNGLWVPDENMHDKIETFVLVSTGITDQEQFYAEQSRYLKIGNHVDTRNLIISNAFVALQEDATVITYENAARIYGPVLGRILVDIMANEAHHKRGYKSIHLGFAKHFPDETVIATEEISDEFDMPGRDGIEGYREKSQVLGYVGLLDPEAMLLSQRQLVNAMDIDEKELKTKEAKESFEGLIAGENKGQRKLKKLARLTDKARQRTLEVGNPETMTVPLIIGETVISSIDKNGVSELTFA